MGKHHKIINFPDKEFILRCRQCKLNAFYIILASEDPDDIKQFECAECGDLFPLENNVLKTCDVELYKWVAHKETLEDLNEQDQAKAELKKSAGI